MQRETCQEPLEEDVLLLPRRTGDSNSRRSQQARRMLMFRRGQLSIYPLLSLLSPFDRVVFGSQELVVSCVLEGSVAWL